MPIFGGLSQPVIPYKQLQDEQSVKTRNRTEDQEIM